jgi:hypothetical protein
MRRAQVEMASRVAGEIDPRNAVPLRMPRAVHTCVALALVAGGLLGLRYRMVGSLDLRPPIVPTPKQLLENARQELAAIRQLFEKPAPAESSDDIGKEPQENAKAHERASKSDPRASAGQPQGSAGGAKSAANNEMATDESESTGESAGDPMGEQNATEGRRSGDSRPGPQRDASSRSGNADQAEPNSSGQQSGETQGIMNRLSNTVSNLMSVFKPQAGGKDKQVSSTNPNGKPQTGRTNGKSPTDQQRGDPSASPGGEEQGDASQRDGSDAASPGNSTEAQTGKQPGSGAGKDDGDKSIRLAEQRKAMGKISMILGRRSENVTGTTAVEVVSGQQELATQYERRKSGHTDVHAKAERDEVPIEYQDYVTHYFKQVRQATTRTRSKPN